ncbi:hypothetical protein HHI36_006336 [Cryptolaemus montrouzieri]|uniref:Uncharacterized protein n=1 Tax=Cryptolaemus montrouzieri TaxID=559131 RepID=A0ABD2NWU6_9CUCU
MWDAKIGSKDQGDTDNIVDVAMRKMKFKTKPKEEKLSADTEKLINDKRKMERDPGEFEDIERQLKKAIRKNLRLYNTKMMRMP